MPIQLFKMLSRCGVYVRHFFLNAALLGVSASPNFLNAVPSWDVQPLEFFNAASLGGACASPNF